MKTILFCVIFSVAAYTVATSKHNLDLRKSIDRIIRQVDVSRTKPADWTQFPEFLTLSLKCIGDDNPLLEISQTLEIPPAWTEFVESLTPKGIVERILDLDINWAQLSEHKVAGDSDTESGVDELKKFVKSKSFDAIHNKLWHTLAFADLIGFLHDAGYPQVYMVTKLLYGLMGRVDLIIPSIPPNVPVPSNTAGISVSYKPTPFPITFKFPSLKKCNPIKMLTILNSSNMHQFFKIFLMASQEFVGNPAIHIFLVKLSEPQMATFINELVELPEMQEFLPLLKTVMLSKQSPFAAVNNINNMITTVSGKDATDPNGFSYGINVIQWLLWGVPLP